MIEGLVSAQEAALLAQIVEVRKQNGGDGENVQVAAEHALDRLAKARTTGGTTYAAAYSDVLATQQGAELYRVVKGHAQTTDAAAALAAIRKIGA